MCFLERESEVVEREYSETELENFRGRENLKNTQVDRERFLRERDRKMEDIEEEEKGEEEVLGSSLTMEKVAAAKQFIENHYRAQMKNIQERKERYLTNSLSFSSIT